MNKPRGEPALGRMLQTLSGEFSDLIGQVIAAAKEHLEADVSFLAEFRGNLKVIRRVNGGGPEAGLEEGSSFPLKGTYCYRVARGKLPNIVKDARNDDRVKDLAITEQLNIGSYVGVPITLPSGRVFGTLCCVNKQADLSLHRRDVKFMRVLADLVKGQLAKEERARESRRCRADRIRGLIAHNRVRIVYQPIIDLVTGAPRSPSGNPTAGSKRLGTSGLALS